jgi:hypothetical protein
MADAFFEKGKCAFTEPFREMRAIVSDDCVRH